MKKRHRWERVLLPSECPQITGYDFCAHHEPASGHGGDYYNFIKVSEDRLVVVLADVSGRDLESARVVFHLANYLQDYAVSAGDPAIVVRRINADLFNKFPSARFAILLYLLLDTTANALTIVNAGHMPPMIRNPGGEVEEVGCEEAGVPLGVFKDSEYTPLTIALESGTVVLIYSDGVSEVTNPSAELFGIHRLLDMLKAVPGGAAQVGPALVEALRTFACGAPQSDHKTLICFGRR